MPALSRRQFLALGTAAGSGVILGNVGLGFTNRDPGVAPFHVHLPAFMASHISPEAVTYLNQVIPALHTAYRDTLFPVFQSLPAFVVINTFNDTLIQHGSEVLLSGTLGDEALTLLEAQYLLATTRFGSVATPHRGENTDLFGRAIYLKQHPDTGYLTPQHLLLEELIHAQQDVTVMRHIIQQDALPPQDCLHAHLKGISELAAHVITDRLSGEADYVFQMDDGTLHDTADAALADLAIRLDVEQPQLLSALLYDVDSYAALDAAAVAEYERHIWQMLTTWRHIRDENGEATGIAPAFVTYEYAANT